MSQYRTLRDAVWAIEGISQPALVVALRLVEHWPRIMPSVAGLAQFTKMSERNVRYALKELEERGIIAIQHVSGRRSVYQFVGVSIPHLGTPADSAPLHHVQPTPADSAPPTPAPRAPEADKILKQTREAGPRRRGALSHLVPESWQPNHNHRAMAEGFGWSHVRFDAEVQDFRDYEFKTPRSEWDRVFNRWIRKSASFPGLNAARRARPEEDDAGYA